MPLRLGMKGSAKGRRRACTMMSWFFLWCVWAVVADEEDPLQHEAQLAARDRQLTQALRLLEVEKPSHEEDGLGDYARYSDILKSDSSGGACKHLTLDFTISPKQYQKFSSGKRAALHTANLLNNLYVTVPEGSDPAYPPHVFYTLLRASMENEPTIVSSAITFLKNEFKAPVDVRASTHDQEEEDEPQFIDGSQRRPPHGNPHESYVREERAKFGAYVYRWEDQIFIADVATLYNNSYDHSQEDGTKWFTHFSQSFRMMPRRINSNSSRSKSSKSSNSGGGSANPSESSPTPSLTLTRESDGVWSPHPMFDCGASRMWVMPYSLPFFGREMDGFNARIKGVVLVNFPLTLVDLNQCDDSDDLLQHHIFSGTHKCDISTTKCVPA